MPKRKHSEPCSICMEAVEQPAKLSGCTHIFCKDCILEWSKRENSCPNCRAPFKHIKCGRKKTKVKRARQRVTPEPERTVVHVTVTSSTASFMERQDIRTHLENDVRLGILGALRAVDRIRKELVHIDRLVASGRMGRVQLRDIQIPIRERLDEALRIWNLRPGAARNPIVI